jgi:hypothetical protein
MTLHTNSHNNFPKSLRGQRRNACWTVLDGVEKSARRDEVMGDMSVTERQFQIPIVLGDFSGMTVPVSHRSVHVC